MKLIIWGTLLLFSLNGQLTVNTNESETNDPIKTQFDDEIPPWPTNETQIRQMPPGISQRMAEREKKEDREKDTSNVSIFKFPIIIFLTLLLPIIFIKMENQATENKERQKINNI